jgi:hypothetical protein
LKIDDIEEEDDDELTTQQSKMLDDILSFLEQCEKRWPAVLLLLVGLNLQLAVALAVH